jgi:hypothetical protein
MQQARAGKTDHEGKLRLEEKRGAGALLGPPLAFTLFFSL